MISQSRGRIWTMPSSMISQGRIWTIRSSIHKAGLLSLLLQLFPAEGAGCAPEKNNHIFKSFFFNCWEFGCLMVLKQWEDWRGDPGEEAEGVCSVQRVAARQEQLLRIRCQAQKNFELEREKNLVASIKVLFADVTLCCLLLLLEVPPLKFLQ